MPSDNNNIVYKIANGEIVYRVVGDPSFIVLKAGEAVTQTVAPDLDNYAINGSGNAVLKQSFPQGQVIGASYFIDNLPNPTTAYFENEVYTVTNGTLQITVEFAGNYTVFLQAPAYIDSKQDFEYDGNPSIDPV